ncbi:MAG: nitrous oxide reductase accessory protein NosL [Gammaproteobacteria bacterium]|nr:nitrous oxide reductase accessory protein NosL [Gammaproteobacteria bacterium]
MLILIKKWTKALSIIALPLMLLACGDKTVEVAHLAVKIESGDECHLCGMLIIQFGGPKGEIFNKRTTKAKKFCSTRDLFSYYLQPENTRQIQQIFVHDMAQTPWDKPNDEHFIDAKTAWYVKDHNQRGSMGATLASFSNKQDAQTFAHEFGGSLITFAQIDFDLLANL